MIPVRRVMSEKRVLVFPLAAALALNALFYAVAVYPLGLKVRNAEERAQNATAGLKRAEEAHAGARATLTDKSRADEELRRFYHEVLPTDLPGARHVLNRVLKIADEAGLRRVNMSTEPKQFKESPLEQLKMTVTLSGDYRDVRTFIYDLETAPEFAVIEDVSLVQGETANAPLQLTLNVTTYHWNKTDGE